jgi:hypothetical protein
MYNKQHLVSLLGYLWIWFIGGSISHGFFSWTRSFIMAIIGIILFILGEYLKWGEKHYGHLIVGWLIYSIAVGMVSGGLQHFLDSPLRSLWIIPVGWIISTIIFPYKEGLTKAKIGKSILIWALISVWWFGLLYLLMEQLPQSLFGVGWHHGTTQPTETTITSNGQIANDETTEVTITQPKHEDDSNHH